MVQLSHPPLVNFHQVYMESCLFANIFANLRLTLKLQYVERGIIIYNLGATKYQFMKNP